APRPSCRLASPTPAPRRSGADDGTGRKNVPPSKIGRKSRPPWCPTAGSAPSFHVRRGADVSGRGSKRVSHPSHGEPSSAHAAAIRTMPTLRGHRALGAGRTGARTLVERVGSLTDRVDAEGGEPRSVRPHATEPI